MKISRIGLDLAKNVFQVHGVDAQERVVVRRQLRRCAVLKYFAQLDRQEDCVVGVEACCGAFYWARELGKLGYVVRIMNPVFVKPYVKGNKTDVRDAEAICEAVGRPTMRFIPVKTLTQQDMATLHRVREQLVKRRTALANQIRGLLLEYGIVVDKRLGALRRALPEILEEAENDLTQMARACFGELYCDMQSLDRRVAQLDRQLERVAETTLDCRRLQAIPGIGPLTATAYVALIGDGRQFKSARQCAAYLGLVPGQHSSGGQERLLGISKRGNRYVRTLFIHGARAALKAARSKTDSRSQWVLGIATRRHANVAAVALANRNARIAWALLVKGEAYRLVA